MKYAIFDNEGFPSAFYSPEINGENIPAEAVQITNEQWQEFIDNNGLRKWVKNKIVVYDPPPPTQAESVTIVYQVDLWSRMSDEEAEEVMTAMAAQPVRIQNIFRSANEYHSTHELWPLLQTVATQLFGTERAAEILASSI